MKTLIAWDDVQEAELLKLYLGMDENQAFAAADPEEALACAQREAWDVVLMSLTLPSHPDQGFAFFTRAQEALPGVPIVIACRQAEMLQLPRFMNHGLRFYSMRDSQGDFVFLMLSCLESAVAATRAEENRKLSERLREEMEGVRRLQESIIPKDLVAPPGYRFAARYEPSQVSVVGDRPVVMAGGDYYDLFCPDDRTLIVLIGDASGHGLKACMSIMTMHTLVRMFSHDRYRDTAAFVAEINRRLCDNWIVKNEGGFITLFYAAIDTVSHTMKWTSAGHPLPMLHGLTSGEIREVGTSADGGLPLGIHGEAEYDSATVAIPPASRVLFYTDGLTDALPMEAGKGHKAFGVHGVQATLRESHADEPEKALDNLFRASTSYTGGAGRHDDTSLVLLERT
jgi:serine phosphatase RsbU (regulator of sigma subunit)